MTFQRLNLLLLALTAAFMLPASPTLWAQPSLDGEVTSSGPTSESEKNADEANAIKFKTEQVIVFKDGYSLVLKKGTARTDANGQIRSSQVPEAAVLGSFWAIPSSGKMISMKAGWVKQEETIEAELACTGTMDILLANIGKQATIRTQKEEYSGTIQQVLTQTNYTQLNSWGDLENLLAPGSNLKKRENASARIVGHHATQFVLKTSTGSVVLPINQLKSLQIEGIASSIKKKVEIKSQRKQLTFQFDAPNQERELTLMYFRPGLKWVPTYRMQLADVQGTGKQSKGQQQKSAAVIALQAELINEMEDLDDVPVKIVVGVPHFRFKDSPSPFALESVLRNVANRGYGGIQSQQLSNAAFSNRRDSRRGGRIDDDPFGDNNEIEFATVPDKVFNLGGSQSHDLFVYSLPNLTLKKGERAAVPVFTEQAAYQDVYTWDLKVTRQDIETGPGGGYGGQAANKAAASVVSPLNISLNKIWHQLDVRNNTPVPWTTGPVMLLQGWQPISQDLLTYTPSKSRVRVPVTVAIDLRGTFDEKETARKLNALTWNRNAYAKIEKQAVVKLVNHKHKTIRTEIKVRLGGKVTSCSGDGKIKLQPYSQADWQNYRGSPAVNNSSQVNWAIELKPGETFEATVDYHYYARQ